MTETFAHDPEADFTISVSTIQVKGMETKSVSLNFSKPAAWVAFSPIEARQLALELMKHATDAETPTTETPNVTG